MRDMVFSFEEGNDRMMKSAFRSPEIKFSDGHFYTRPPRKTDDEWHEEQINKQSVLEDTINEYINNFSMHGLTKVFKAKTTFEGLFWLVMLVSGVLLSMSITQGLIDKYLKYEVYTDVRLTITDQNIFPSITVCERSLLYKAYYAYCGHSSPHPSSSLPCLNRTVYSTRRQFSSDNQTWWSNGLFNVTTCSTWSGKRCTINHYLKSLTRYNHACFTWNYHGNLYDSYSHVELEFRFINESLAINDYNKSDIIFLAHDPHITEIDLTKAISIEPRLYQIGLEKTIIKRLPFPFPSQCTNKKHGDIFPGRYTRRNCLESINYVNMFKECGDTIDYVRMYVPDEIKRRYSKNHTINEISECMTNYELKELSTEICPLPCQEYDLNMMVSTRSYFTGDEKIDSNTYTISLQYSTVDSYRTIQEKQLYSAYQLACEIGGLVGLLVGFSLLSGIEMVVCMAMCVVNRLRQ